ncbi:MAG TPA: hypothetical protein VFJ12_15470 [Segeticoccus sp.]|nr:hypothetical protein [Segeticoccus sp.]
MVLVLFMLSALVAAVALWATRRHVAMSAWDRELESAFGNAERKEIPLHRVL